jgi:hypothetical protein
LHMRADLELASFRGDDHPGLVAAALACPLCLSGSVEWSLAPDDFGGEARCRCRDCGYRHDVALSFEQALRLALQRDRPLPGDGPLVVGEPVH